MFKKKYDKDTGYEINHTAMSKFCDDISWDEFYTRYVDKKEEFAFWYNNKIIDLFNYSGKAYLRYGDHKSGQVTTFNSQILLLENARFDGKSLRDIYNELE